MLKLLWPSIFAICINLAISSEDSDGFDRNPASRNSGMNFYGEAPDISEVRSPEVLFFDACDCAENSDNGQSSFFNDPDFCCEGAEPIQCNYSSPYRKYDGSCNNPYVPRFGMTEICFLRLTPAYYEGKGDLRKSVTGNPLPNARYISQKILKDKHRPTVEVTYLFTAHGQIIAHDLSRAVQPDINCCLSENAKKEDCIAISVRRDDPFYSKFNRTCLPMPRNKECTFCKTAHRTQKNYATATLDINIIYGVRKKKVDELRTHDGTGKLRSTGRSNGYLLPAGKDPEDIFCPKGQDSNCFLAGDSRVNMHASLTSLQTIFMREHNRVTTKLRRLNPHWGEEKLFQEARTILIAEHQCITFKEYLPILLGPRIVELFDLTVKPGSRGTIYNSEIILGVFQEFTVAAFRLHSMVPTYIGLSNFQFRNTLGNPSMIREGGILNITSGSYQVPSEKYDRWMITDLSGYYNNQPGSPFEVDLTAVDIQRGRDHGLSPYVEVVKFCSGGTVIISCYEDLYELSLMPKENIMLLQNMYNDVKDVDMLIGMQMEYHYPGSQLGPSATCINIIQFYSTQKGDRFYFDHEGPGAPFTPDQRSALKKCSMARIICDNTKNTHITGNPFLLPGYANPDVPCKQIPKIDLTLWKESTFSVKDALTDC